MFNIYYSCCILAMIQNSYFVHFIVISARFGQAEQEQDLNTTRGAVGGSQEEH